MVELGRVMDTDKVPMGPLVLDKGATATSTGLQGFLGMIGPPPLPSLLA